MKLFLDTNVLLDVLAQRQPHTVASSEIWSMVEQGATEGYISAISFNNVNYVLRRFANRQAASEGIRLLRDVFKIVALDDRIIHRAIDADFADFEDAIQFFSANQAGADFIITRNVRHFPLRPIPAILPEEFLKAKL